jgi:fatty-acyl-CoA synthase
MNVPLTPLRCLRYAEQQYPRKAAVVCNDLRFTYAEFAARCALLGGALRAARIKAGDRVAFLSTNCHRLLEAYYGVLEAGAVLLPLNVRLAPDELTYILNDSGARILFVEKDFLGVVDSFREKLTSVESFHLLNAAPQADWLAAENYEAMLAGASPYRTDIMDVDENALAELFYTSGTSANPKGVMLTHRNVYLHALYACLTDDPTVEHVQLHTIPLFHANGWGLTHTMALVGGRHVMIQRFETKRVFQLVEQERVRTLFLVPAMATALVNCPERPKHDLRSLHLVMIGGAASSPTLIRQVEETFHVTCRSGYGLTETSPVLSVARMKPGLAWENDQKYVRQAMTGHAIPGVELRVVDANDHDVPHDASSIGEIVARSDVVMAGYWRQPESTAEVMRGGWFHTGDMATINEDGYLLIVDRKKEIIVSGGENVSSLEVEKVILEHPSVYEVAVIPVPDERWGEVPKALVVLKPGAELAAQELIDFCRARVAHYKSPQSVEFLQSLPRTGTGKVLKRELRKKYWGGQDTIRPDFTSRKAGSP